MESQVVLRVTEGFSFEDFNHDKDKLFADKEEAYEMAYLMIVLQTTMHNPSIKQKLRAEDFIAQAKACCPKSYDSLPDKYMNILYEKDVQTTTPEKVENESVPLSVHLVQTRQDDDPSKIEGMLMEDPNIPLNLRLVHIETKEGDELIKIE